jgi:two-component system chemotaxis response regulator CheY
LQTFLQQVLTGYGFDAAAIKTTGNPHAAAEIAPSHKPDFLVTDWFAKESLSGIGLHRQLVSANPGCRFALMAQSAGATLAQEARDAGALFFLPKPFSADSARSEMARALDQLAANHPKVAKQVQSWQMGATATRAAMVQLPALPKFKPGDRVVYKGQTEVVQHVILRRGEMVVQLRDVAGLIESSKIQPR